MISKLVSDFMAMPFEQQAAIVGQIVVTIAAVVKAWRSSTKASFFQKAHEAVVVGIEKSDCDECREFAKKEAEALGIEAKVKPVVQLIKATLPEAPSGGEQR